MSRSVIEILNLSYPKFEHLKMVLTAMSHCETFKGFKEVHSLNCSEHIFSGNCQSIQSQCITTSKYLILPYKSIYLNFDKFWTANQRGTASFNEGQILIAILHWKLHRVHTEVNRIPYMLPNLVVKKAPSFSESWGWSDRTLSWIIRMKKSLTCHHTQVQSGHFYHTAPIHHIVGYFLVALLTTIVKWAGSIAETLRLHTKSCSSHCLSSQVDQFCPVLHLCLQTDLQSSACMPVPTPQKLIVKVTVFPPDQAHPRANTLMVYHDPQ
jgi:hypothetical protein